MSAHKLFAVFASVYPAQPATAFWRAIEMKVLANRAIPAGRGLDLGCGDGILTGVLLNEVGERNLVGIDLDPLETTAARRHAFYSAVHTCSADAIPEPAASFDFVVSNSVLEHIPPLEGTIAEVARLLKKGGRFFFTVPGPAFHDNLAGSALPWVSREQYLTDLDARLAHFHYLSPDDWKQLLDRHGLVLDQCEGYLTRAQTRRWETLSKMTGGLLYSLFGKAKRPIEIQRTLGARALQNRMHLPRPLATLVGRLIRLGTSVDTPALGVAGASCLMVEGHRP
jgi:SAM-dependent methyltransferase